MKNEIRCFKMVGISTKAQESVESGDGKYCKIQDFQPNGSSTQYAIEFPAPGIVMDGEELITRLASVYNKDRVMVATICDEVLDRTGALLGEVRNSAHKELYPEITEKDIDHAIHDVCVLQERINFYHKHHPTLVDEITKLEKRQHAAVKLVINKGETPMGDGELDKLWKKYSKITKKGYTVYETMTFKEFEAAFKDFNNE